MMITTTNPGLGIVKDTPPGRLNDATSMIKWVAIGGGIIWFLAALQGARS